MRKTMWAPDLSSTDLYSVVASWVVASWVFASVAAAQSGAIDLAGLAADSAISIRQVDGALEAEWPIEGGEGRGGGRAVLRVRPGPEVLLDASISRAGGGAGGGAVGGAVGGTESGGTTQQIFSDARVVYTLSVGERDLKPSGWTVFFDRVDERPFKTHPVALSGATVKAASTATRAVITVGPASAGGFQGDLQLTLIAGSPLVQVEMVLSTKEDSRAILFDAALELPRSAAGRIVYETWDRKLIKQGPAELMTGPVRTRLRTMVAESAGEGGAVAVFPTPHQFFYPLDFGNNFGFNKVEVTADRVAIGVRQPPHGDKRYRPWVNAPPGTAQRLCFFLLLEDGPAEKALERVRAFTRDDRVPAIPGHKAMISHLHVEHTAEFLRQQREAADPDSVPFALLDPGWAQLCRQQGVEIVHLAEFHFGDTPKRDAKRRVADLKALHGEARRLSGENFLVLPGEEPNVHLGGHWISFFPRPVYWVLNRTADEPFAERVEGLGTLYRVGSSSDVLELMKRENGLMWTAHPRIKASQNFPDAYLKNDFFASPHFLGGAWKNMPADYSLDRLGGRVLGLADDLANRGFRKPILGEIDLFQLDPTYELYGHLNVNYLQLDKLPAFEESWQPILDALRGGRFFTTTGEVLITDVAVAGVATGGEVAAASATAATAVTAKLVFTFPPAFAEVVSGDGEKVYRDRIDLSGLPAFATHELKANVNLAGRTWARVEAWDIARNGAFTPAVWIAK